MLHLIRYDSLCIFVYSLIPSGYRKGEGLFGLVTENQKARLVFHVVDVVESCVNCLPLGLGRRLVLQKEGGEQSCEAKQKHNRDSMRLHMIASKTADVYLHKWAKKGNQMQLISMADGYVVVAFPGSPSDESGCNFPMNYLWPRETDASPWGIG